MAVVWCTLTHQEGPSDARAQNRDGIEAVLEALKSVFLYSKRPWRDVCPFTDILASLLYLWDAHGI
eukprot:gene21835-biopygen7613